MHLTRSLAREGIPAASALLGRVPALDRAGLVKELAFLLFTIAEGRKTHQDRPRLQRPGYRMARDRRRCRPQQQRNRRSRPSTSRGTRWRAATVTESGAALELLGQALDPFITGATRDKIPDGKDWTMLLARQGRR